MPKLVLESATDTFDLDDILQKGRGVQALTGTAGLGLPPVSVQWLEGAGDGAVYRGKRVLPRDIDLPLHFKLNDRADLTTWLDRFSRICAQEATLRLVQDDGTDWSVKVHRIGGGEYVYGQDTIGTDDFSTVITFRAGDPFWLHSRTASQRVQSSGSGSGLLNGSLSSMSVSPSQAIGEITLENLGTAYAYPKWIVDGPGRDFRATALNGEEFLWEGALALGEQLIVDTQRGTVKDGTGVNRYADLAPAPRLWSIPAGTTSASVSLSGVDSNSSILCSWRPRNWMVV